MGHGRQANWPSPSLPAKSRADLQLGRRSTAQARLNTSNDVTFASGLSFGPPARAERRECPHRPSGRASTATRTTSNAGSAENAQREGHPVPAPSLPGDSHRTVRECRHVAAPSSEADPACTISAVSTAAGTKHDLTTTRDLGPRMAFLGASRRRREGVFLSCPLPWRSHGVTGRGCPSPARDHRIPDWGDRIPCQSRSRRNLRNPVRNGTAGRNRTARLPCCQR